MPPGTANINFSKQKVPGIQCDATLDFHYAKPARRVSTAVCCKNASRCPVLGVKVTHVTFIHVSFRGKPIDQKKGFDESFPLIWLLLTGLS